MLLSDTYNTHLTAHKLTGIFTSILDTNLFGPNGISHFDAHNCETKIVILMRSYIIYNLFSERFRQGLSQTNEKYVVDYLHYGVNLNTG